MLLTVLYKVYNTIICACIFIDGYMLMFFKAVIELVCYNFYILICLYFFVQINTKKNKKTRKQWTFPGQIMKL